MLKARPAKLRDAAAIAEIYKARAYERSTDDCAIVERPPGAAAE